MSNTPREDAARADFARTMELCELQSAFEDSVTAQEKAEAENAALREALSRLVAVYDAMGGICGSARIAAEAALAKEEGK